MAHARTTNVPPLIVRYRCRCGKEAVVDVTSRGAAVGHRDGDIDHGWMIPMSVVVQEAPRPTGMPLSALPGAADAPPGVAREDTASRRIPNSETPYPEPTVTEYLDELFKEA
jgi:hypothetical protein